MARRLLPNEIDETQVHKEAYGVFLQLDAIERKCDLLIAKTQQNGTVERLGFGPHQEELITHDAKHEIERIKAVALEAHEKLSLLAGQSADPTIQVFGPGRKEEIEALTTEA